jgi:hypothetical protein
LNPLRSESPLLWGRADLEKPGLELRWLGGAGGTGADLEKPDLELR